jgi:hypothetical protein
MRICIGSFIFIIAISSCTFGLNLEDYKIGAMDLDNAWKITAAFDYISELGDYWKSPKEFEFDGGGDCEDFAIYLMYLLGPESKLIIVYDDDYKHALVLWENEFLEPQIYKCKVKLNSNIKYTVSSYNRVMAFATKNGTKSIGE